MTERYYEALNILVRAERMGRDICVQISGGDSPHIGSVSIAEPRNSLDGSGRGAATVSTYNYVGHKDHFVSDPVAEKLSAALQCRVVVLCGIHYDNAGPKLVRAVTGLTAQITDDLLRLLKT